MTQTTHLTITDHLASRGSLQANFSSISDLVVSNSTCLGSHSFSPQQLGDLLALLLTLHPELSI